MQLKHLSYLIVFMIGWLIYMGMHLVECSLWVGYKENNIVYEWFILIFWKPILKILYDHTHQWPSF
jgi:hypothetical protein